MSNENKEKNFPETPENNQDNNEGKWEWDASVPETQTDDITIEDLGVTTEAAPEQVAEAEAPAEDSTETAADVQEDPTEEEEKDPNDDGLCIVCGKPRKDSPSDLYCPVCRKKYLKTSYGVSHIILAVVMMLFASFSYFVCVPTVKQAVQIAKAESYMAEKRYNDAVNACMEISSENETLNNGFNAVLASFNKNHKSKLFFVDGNRSVRVLISAYADTISFDEDQMSTFVRFVDGSLSKNALKKSSNANIKKVYDFCKEVVAYSNSIANDWSKFFYTDKNDSKQKIKYNEAISFLENSKNDTVAQKCVNEYYKAIAGFYAQKAPEVIYGNFDKACEYAGDLDYFFMADYLYIAWSNEDYDRSIKLAEALFEKNINNTDAYYYAIKANLLQGDFDAADERCELMKDANSDGVEYYSIKAEILRRKGQFDESVGICKEGIKLSADAELYRQQAISYMLLDDKDAAIEAIRQAYEICLQNAYSGTEISLEVINTVALIGGICGEKDLYDDSCSILEQSSMALEEKVQNCIKGEITFEEIFMEGTGDV